MIFNDKDKVDSLTLFWSYFSWTVIFNGYYQNVPDSSLDKKYDQNNYSQPDNDTDISKYPRGWCCIN